MDLDEDDFEEGVQRLTVPGDSITSSHVFMRYASLFDLGRTRGRTYTLGTAQWTWDICRR